MRSPPGGPIRAAQHNLKHCGDKNKKRDSRGGVSRGWWWLRPLGRKWLRFPSWEEKLTRGPFLSWGGSGGHVTREPTRIAAPGDVSPPITAAVTAVNLPDWHNQEVGLVLETLDWVQVNEKHRQQNGWRSTESPGSDSKIHWISRKWLEDPLNLQEVTPSFSESPRSDSYKTQIILSSSSQNLSKKEVQVWNLQWRRPALVFWNVQ